MISISAIACIEDICRGDLVIPENYSTGLAEVTEVGTRDGQITVQRSDSLNAESYSVSEIAITKGCYSDVCMDQKVIPDTYSRGFAFVEGINKYRRTFTVKVNLSRDYHRNKHRELAFTRGCLNGFCTGDQVVPFNYGRGFAIVQAINPTLGSFTVLGNLSSDYHRYSSLQMRILQANPEFTYIERQRGTFGNSTEE